MKRTSFLFTSVLAPWTAFSFAPVSLQSPRRWRKPFISSLTAETASTISSHSTSDPPAWEDLKARISQIPQKEPVLTLYRDTNGWCPFCERVWLALEVKKIPYKERLINLRDKPEWYKDLVPTTLVPAVLFHGDSNSNERKIIWESLDIMKALDDAFPETPKLILNSPEYQEAVALQNELTSAGFSFTTASRNESITDADKLARQDVFEEALNKLDASLAALGGPFRLGPIFTGVDVMMIPTMERWRYQLPITVQFNILQGRPSIQKWFETMDDFTPYSGRIAGDEYSWTATAAQFLRYFGGGEDKPEIAAAIVRAENAAQVLTTSFSQVNGNPMKASTVEAVTTLLSNYDAVVNDCTREVPISQQSIGRAVDKGVTNKLLRYVASILLSENVFESAMNAPLLDLNAVERADAIIAARTVAARLCVPRDMGGPAAKVLRGTLAIVADRLDAI